MSLTLVETVIAECRASRFVMQVHKPFLVVPITQVELQIVAWHGNNFDAVTQGQRDAAFGLNDQIAAVLGVQAEDEVTEIDCRDGASHSSHHLFVAWLSNGWLVVHETRSLQAGLLLAQGRFPEACVIKVWNLCCALWRRKESR
jgi:hypothetical protein